MSAIFLSASVPVVGRGNYYQTADPFLIQYAVRELVTIAIRDRQIVWGGHPAITPMVLAICEGLAVDYSQRVVLYQSRFFESVFPEENRQFNNVVLVDAVPGDRGQSLRRLREVMLSRGDLVAAVFIGGMEGVVEEYQLFRQYHPQAKVVPVPASGGAALDLARELGVSESSIRDVDFARLFHSELNI